MLENKYYQIISVQSGELSATFHIAILPDCDVYRGHFPGNPVCPGVCNIETLRECVSKLLHKKVRISTIKQCRLTAVATPTTCSELDVKVEVTPVGENYTVTASIFDGGKTYMEFKGDMTV